MTEKTRKPRALKLGTTHVWFKEINGNEIVAPIATIELVQGMHGVPTVFHCAGQHVTRQVFDAVIALLKE